MYKILTGQQNAPKIVQAIREILELSEQGLYMVEAEKSQDSA